MTKKRKQHPAPGDDASTAEATSGRVGREEQDEARRANTTPSGGPHLELGRLRLKTWSKTDFSIAETTGPTYLYIHTSTHVLFLDVCTLFSGARGSFLALSAAGHAGEAPVHHSASLGPERAPWCLLWAFKLVNTPRPRLPPKLKKHIFPLIMYLKFYLVPCR